MMLTDLDYTMLGRALLAVVLGGLIGWERRYQHHIESQIRTFAAVALGACTFGMVSMIAAGDKAPPTMISAQVVSAIGFLGAGVIFHDRDRTTGLATAALLWATASVGLALAHGLYILGVGNALAIFVVRHFPSFFSQKYTEDKPKPAGDQDSPGA